MVVSRKMLNESQEVLIESHKGLSENMAARTGGGPRSSYSCSAPSPPRSTSFNGLLRFVVLLT